MSKENTSEEYEVTIKDMVGVAMFLFGLVFFVAQVYALIRG
jgi:hypothetical protein